MWVPDDKEMFLPGKVQKSFKPGEDGSIKFEDGRAYTIPGKASKECLAMDEAALQTYENMIKLNNLNEPVILHNLRQRFMKDQIYTYVSSILVALNPFKLLPIYTPEIMDKYKEGGASGGGGGGGGGSRGAAAAAPRARGAAWRGLQLCFNVCHARGVPRGRRRGLLLSCLALAAASAAPHPAPARRAPPRPPVRACAGGRSQPPHIFAVSDNAYRNLMSEFKDQAVVISGESGAGKTETMKLVLQFLADVSGRAQKASATGEKQESLEQQVLKSNPVMEAFGNAKTTRNNNSSRFGKWTEIKFNRQGAIVGGSIINYLLEKSRIPFQAQQERNYHIFYQLLAGGEIDPALKKALKCVRRRQAGPPVRRSVSGPRAGCAPRRRPSPPPSPPAGCATPRSSAT